MAVAQTKNAGGGEELMKYCLAARNAQNDVRVFLFLSVKKKKPGPHLCQES